MSFRPFVTAGKTTYRPITDERAAAVAAAYLAGDKVADIASRYKTSNIRVVETVKSLGIATRGKGGPQRRFGLEEDRATVERLWASGGTVPEIARECRCSTKLVRAVLTKAGVYGGRLRGSRHPKWRGGKVLTDDGYLLVYEDPNGPWGSMVGQRGYVLEHRLVMAQYLGRPLAKWETVHHVDGDKLRNDITNLQLRIGHHGAGQAYCCLDCGSRNVSPVHLADKVYGNIAA